MKKIIWILIGIVIMGIAYADRGLIEIYKPREVFDLSVHASNNTGDVLGASCNAQIRYQNYSIKDDGVMNDIGGGWYNYTYNTSTAGKYFCRQNCTQGSQFISGTCDFIIKGDENMPVEIIIMMSLIVACYLFILWYLSKERFAQHGIIKASLIIFIFWFLLIPLNFGLQSMRDNGASDSLIEIVGIVHIIMIYLNLMLTAYLILFVIVSFMRSMNENV